MNKRLRLAVRNATCDACSMCQHAEPEDVCTTGTGSNDASIMVVTKFPMDEESRARRELSKYLTDAGIDLTKVMWCAAIKCRSWDVDPNNAALKACRPYLQAEIQHVKPTHVLALGNEALFAAAGRKGIMKYRAKMFEVDGTTVFPTISPSMAARNPGLRAGLESDLSYFARLVSGKVITADPDLVPGPDRTVVVNTKDALSAMVKALAGAVAASYDVETTGASEFTPDAAVVSLSITTTNGVDMAGAVVWEIPLFHPESPWRLQWRQVFAIVTRALAKVRKRIAHNAKYDTRWHLRFGGVDVAPTFDTIMALALLNENGQKGLKPAAQSRLGAEPWGIDTSDLLNTPLAQVLEYNGLDTWHAMRLYYQLREEIAAQPKLHKLFTRLAMPLVRELVHVEHAGVFIDQERLTTNWAIAQRTLDDIERELTTHVPDPTDVDEDDLPSGVLNKKTHQFNVNWNASNFARWFLFTYLQLPILGRGKQKDDGRPGDPSMAEDLLKTLAEDHEVPRLLVTRVKWNKFVTAFFRGYSEQIDDNSRVHATFKPWGTVTGRMSSGKEDEEKVASRVNKRGLNLQQVPRDPLVRGVFGAPDNHWFVEADYSQVELRIAAFLARELTMLHLYNTGQDIHTAMAMQMTGKPKSAITGEERKAAKAVNFGFLYGMGWAKFVQTAWSTYGLRVTEEEARAFRTAFFQQYPLLIPWHNRQRALVRKYKRVQTPMGRIRHLPDIDSPVQGIRAEAERQAINSPVQAFASDMASLSLVKLSQRFRTTGMSAHPIGAVHDAVNFEIPREELHVALPMIKHTMENLPLEQEFSVALDVPIVADLKVGKHWGGATKIPPDLLTDPGMRLGKWLEENLA